LTAQARSWRSVAHAATFVGPPLGNMTLPWREWVRLNLVDRLVIDQNSSQCPSMWHQLWPMHRGTGYVQNYLDGSGLPPLGEHVTTTYCAARRGEQRRALRGASVVRAIA
jgi:hypothetical protein